MAKNRVIRYVATAVICLMCASVAGASESTTPAGKSNNDFIRQNVDEMKTTAPKAGGPPTPDFSPVSEELSPVKTKRVSISARNTSLGDVLYVIAEATGLNLSINRGVNMDTPITLTLKNVTCEHALSSIFATLDYFYTITDNMLVVEAVTTKFFELGHPALVQNYKIDVGGDILGSSATSGLKGTVSQDAKSDGKAFDFWTSLEDSLKNMIKANKEQTITTTTNTEQKQDHVAQNILGSNTKYNNASNLNVEETKKTVIKPPDTQNTGSSPDQNVTINRQSGTIIVTANRRNMLMVDNYVDTLKKVMSRQVLVEARIVEVQLTDTMKFGIDWDFVQSQGIKWFNTTGALTGGFGNTVNAANSALQNGAFRLGYSDGNVQLLLSALKTQGDVKTLSNPRISVMNGQSAMLTVGRSNSYISKVSSSTTTTAGSAPTTTVNVETGSILSGMLLGIVPYINAKGEISMTITPIISDLVDLTEKKIGSATGDLVSLSIPTVDLRELSTTVKVKGGEMVVIGGLISKRDKKNTEKVPFLGDIPWIGTLFTRINNEETRSELVVILQPFLSPSADSQDKL